MPQDAAALINSTRLAGGRIIAVGTTSVRTLETVAKDGCAHRGSGSTNLFITPGYSFQLVDALVTNFHLPRSTLLALVAAFAGLDTILKAYRYAIEHKYRFYSYGDAMLIL
jgi:S-adenosylmethionine:tRNA ribosyltransferase-isomerase